MTETFTPEGAGVDDEWNENGVALGKTVHRLSLLLVYSEAEMYNKNKSTTGRFTIAIQLPYHFVFSIN